MSLIIYSYNGLHPSFVSIAYRSCLFIHQLAMIFLPSLPPSYGAPFPAGYCYYLAKGFKLFNVDKLNRLLIPGSSAALAILD